jgi:hypothetical protein
LPLRPGILGSAGCGAVIGDDGVGAVLAARDMAAERRGAAALKREGTLFLDLVK